MNEMQLRLRADRDSDGAEVVSPLLIDGLGGQRVSAVRESQRRDAPRTCGVGVDEVPLT